MIISHMLLQVEAWHSTRLRIIELAHLLALKNRTSRNRIVRKRLLLREIIDEIIYDPTTVFVVGYGLM